jgi:hypothetical protein
MSKLNVEKMEKDKSTFTSPRGVTLGVGIAGLRPNTRVRAILMLRWTWIFSNQSSNRQNPWAYRALS